MKLPVNYLACQCDQATAWAIVSALIQLGVPVDYTNDERGKAEFRLMWNHYSQCGVGWGGWREITLYDGSDPDNEVPVADFCAAFGLEWPLKT